MARATESTGLKATRSGLWVYFMCRHGAAVRPAAVKIPWHQVADAMEHITQGAENVFTQRLRAAESQDWLPLEKWE